jgi:hypothetical protein
MMIMGRRMGFAKKHALFLVAVLLILVIIGIFSVAFNIFLPSNNLTDNQANDNSVEKIFPANLTATANASDKIGRVLDYLVIVPTLSIRAVVNNTGDKIACNVGLQITAYETSTKSLLLNIVVPLEGGTFQDGLASSVLSGLPRLSSIDRSNYYLEGHKSIDSYVTIYHRFVFSNSTIYQVTPVWTNAP